MQKVLVLFAEVMRKLLKYEIADNVRTYTVLGATAVLIFKFNVQHVYLLSLAC